MTRWARRLASRTSDTCPSWRAPMVGTNAVIAFLPRKASTARRKAGTVRTTMGLRDIWIQSLGLVREGSTTGETNLNLLDAEGERPYQGEGGDAKAAGART